MDAFTHSGTNLEYTKAYNRQVTLQAVRLHGPISRPELIGLTGLTAQTVSTITNELLEKGLIVVTGRRVHGRGHPAIVLEINPQGGFAIGVNLDQDRISLLLVDLKGTVRHRREFHVDFPPPSEALPLVASAVREIVEAEPGCEDILLGIGVAVPGRLSLQQEIVYPPKKLRAWRHVPIAKRLTKMTGFPVILENDANAAAIGEILYGVSREFRDYFYIFLGMGLGCGIVINGIPYRGATGFAGEFGLFPTALPHSPTAEGKGFAHLSDHVSLFSLYRELEADGRPCAGPEKLAGLLKAGDPLIGEWLDRAAGYLLQPLAVMQCVLDPQAILFGGPAPAAILDALLLRLNERLKGWKNSKLIAPTLMRAKSGVDAAALGAAVLPVFNALSAHHATLLKRGPSDAASVGDGGIG